MGFKLPPQAAKIMRAKGFKMGAGGARLAKLQKECNEAARLLKVAGDAGRAALNDAARAAAVNEMRKILENSHKTDQELAAAANPRMMSDEQMMNCAVRCRTA